MMKQTNALKQCATLLALGLLFTSCATIFTKSSYPLSINSNPTNAQISIVDKKGKEVYLGNTPATVTLKAGAGFFSKAEYAVKLSSPGHSDRIVPVIFKIDGWYFGNLLVGGLIGMLIIDPATGAMWKMENASINETLSPTTAATRQAELKIMELKNVPEEWKVRMEKVEFGR